jgi:uncharacterized membrane protein
VAVLYVSIYAAFNFYRLIEHGAAFTMMCGVTLVAAALADAEDAQLLALFAVGGGFLTPFLLADAGANEQALFGYDTVLIAGAMLMARRRRWPALNAVSYFFTVFTVAAWLLVWYRPATYLATELFITLFCAMFVYAAVERRGADDPLARAVQLVLTSAPALYYLASLGVLSSHPPALVVYLVGVSILGALIGARTGAPVRVVALALSAVPLLLWSATARAQVWMDAGLVGWAAIFAVNLAGLLEATLRDEAPFLDLDVVQLHSNGLAAYFGIYLLLSPGSLSSAAAAAFGLALLSVVAAVAVGGERRDEALHFIALGLTLLSIAFGIQLEGAWLTTAWAVEGAAIVYLALRESRTWLWFGGFALFAIAAARLLALQSAPPASDETVLLNARALTGLLVTALAYLLAKAHERRAPSAAGVLLVSANALALLVLTSEINAYWASAARRQGRTLAREMMLSITWAGYAMFLILAGFRKRYAPLRYLAIMLFAFTIAKVFLVDLAELDQIYRVLSVVGLGAALLASSYVYQRFRPRGTG